MEKLKNVRRGMLVIADAGLKLKPGQTVEVETITKQMEALVASGHLARIDKKPEESGQEQAPETPNLPTMTAQEAIASANTMDDPDRAKAQMRTEKRRSALDALGQKKKELTGGNE
ncbi:MAG TPA: hypothetical protein P5540_07955 [Candidatus Hydrogenedentes bacterium]|nr:hypothetical protein [Candidatus Hydrogenedentota bacterium]